MKRTYQLNTRRRKHKHGFRHCMQTRAGRAIIKSRRQKGRARLSKLIKSLVKRKDFLVLQRDGQRVRRGPIQVQFLSRSIKSEDVNSVFIDMPLVEMSGLQFLEQDSTAVKRNYVSDI